MRSIDCRTESYGPLKVHQGDLHLPVGHHLPVVCLFHGGFWRMPYGREQMTDIARDLALQGYAVWNLEYRRLGTPASGWPGTFDDVIAGIEHLAQLAANGVDLDLTRVAVVGHSAGGQLALWAAARLSVGKTNCEECPVRITAAVGQAALVDLVHAYELEVGRSAIAELLDGAPTERFARYELASPRALLPLGIPQLILHGTADDVVPIELARAYAQTAKDTGDRVELLELAGTGHMDYLNPSSNAHAALCTWLGSWSGNGT